MFTGIVEDLGTVASLEKRKNLFVLKVRVSKALQKTRPGDSVSVNGVCLTASSVKNNVLGFDLMKETIKSTTLGNLRKGHRVNLERALKADSRFGGHFVTGHVDGIGTIQTISKGTNYVEWRIALPVKLLQYIVPKGSVAVEGVSLTVGDVGKKSFSVYLIPYTLKVTTFGNKKSRDKLNVETDILAKYVLSVKR